MINNSNNGVFVQKVTLKLNFFKKCTQKIMLEMRQMVAKIWKNLYKIRSRTRYARLEDTAQNCVFLYKIRLIGERIRDFVFS